MMLTSSMIPTTATRPEPSDESNLRRQVETHGAYLAALEAAAEHAETTEERALVAAALADARKALAAYRAKVAAVDDYAPTLAAAEDALTEAAQEHARAGAALTIGATDAKSALKLRDAADAASIVLRTRAADADRARTKAKGLLSDDRAFQRLWSDAASAAQGVVATHNTSVRGDVLAIRHECAAIASRARSAPLFVAHLLALVAAQPEGEKRLELRETVRQLATYAKSKVAK